MHSGGFCFKNSGDNMNRSPWAKSGILAALSCFGLMHGQAYAADGDSLSLKIEQALRGHMFMRASVLSVKVKTKSGETTDVTGPVMTRDELAALLRYRGINPATGLPRTPAPMIGSTEATPGASTALREYLFGQGYFATRDEAASAAIRLSAVNTGAGQLIRAMDGNGVTALGTPAGITGEAKKNMVTGGFSLGYYLDDDFRWAVETFVLAAPLSTSVIAHGKSTWREDPDAVGGYALRPFGLEGQKIISSKLLPPTLMFGRYWNIPGTRIQPYTGLIAMYAIFYDTKASEALNSYVGGTTPGGTTVSFKNAFGAGPMLGFKYELNDSWHVGLSVGSVKLKTVATITTRNTLFTKSSGATQDFGYPESSPPTADSSPSVSDSIKTGETLFVPGVSGVTQNLISAVEKSGGLTSLVSKAVAYSRGQSDLGTYVRKNETQLDSTILMMSVGYKF
jgi:outer membrane protein W